MNRKTFVLGVGAQKAGTTWLHSYIAASERCCMGLIKEYHTWDALFSPICRNFRIKKTSLLRPNRENYLRFAMQNIPFFYENYFKHILSKGAVLTGDITPSYSVLSEGHFRKLKARINSLDVRIKCVFLMRDPLERCWGAARMHSRKLDSDRSDEQVLRDSYSSAQYEFRTRYEVVCENLKSVFLEDELYFGFYESMHTEREIRRLSDFLGVEPNIQHRDVHVNVSKKAGKISGSLRQEIREFYKDTYEYCFSEFPVTNSLWA